MMAKITAAGAVMRVFKAWDVTHVYGIPGGSINSLMDALYQARESVHYIQVRHEETGAMAASTHAKLTGKIGVCFGSAGPGATHLMNGLYDAAMDHVPVLALIGQVASTAMNTDTFQEMNENPMFVDVSIYNRTVMTPNSLPAVIDEAIRQAYEHKGVAVVTIPVDFGFAMIEDDFVPTASVHRTGVLEPCESDVRQALALLEKAERPVLYVGQGCAGGSAQVIDCAHHFGMPIVSSVLAKGLIPDDEPYYMGTAARVASKPANEALAASDLILFAGSNFPFAKFFFPKDARFIQIDIDSSKLGKRHVTDAVILGDAQTALALMTKWGKKRIETPFLKACVENRRLWQKWIKGFEQSREEPLRPEPVFHEINRIAQEDAVFVTDVGNCTIFAVRMLNMNGKRQMFATSGWFATMGYGVPGGIAAGLNWPDRQIFTLSGDGAFAMVMQDVLTQVKYHLPVINVVFSNGSLGFIDAEQEDTNKQIFGVDLKEADFGKAAEAMGAIGITVRHFEELRPAFEVARRREKPIVIDVKITNERPYPAEAMILDTTRFSAQAVEAFQKRYRSDMPPLGTLMGK